MSPDISPTTSFRSPNSGTDYSFPNFGNWGMSSLSPNSIPPLRPCYNVKAFGGNEMMLSLRIHDLRMGFHSRSIGSIPAQGKEAKKETRIKC